MPESLIPYLWTLGGLVLLTLSGDAVVRGAVGVARHSGVSLLLIGLVVVAFGTSSPELVIAIQAVMEGAPDVAVGNVVGSNIANIFLVLGVGALLCPIPLQKNILARDGITMLAASGFLVYLGYTEVISFWAGVILASSLVAYIAYSYSTDHRANNATAAENRKNLVDSLNGHGLLYHGALLVGGIAGLIFGARFLIFGAQEVARSFGVSDAVISVSIVALGTSLPELVTVGVAAMRKQPQIVLGSIVGSNIFNILAVLGITAMIAPVTVDRAFFDFDLWIMLGVVLIFLVFLSSNRELSRLEGVAMLAGYGTYIILIFTDVPTRLFPWASQYGAP